MKRYIKSMLALLLAGVFLASCGSETVKLEGDDDHTVQDDQMQTDPDYTQGSDGTQNGSNVNGGSQGVTEDPSVNGGEDPDGSYVVGPAADTLRKIGRAHV